MACGPIIDQFAPQTPFVMTTRHIYYPPACSKAYTAVEFELTVSGLKRLGGNTTTCLQATQRFDAAARKFIRPELVKDLKNTRDQAGENIPAFDHRPTRS